MKEEAMANGNHSSGSGRTSGPGDGAAWRDVPIDWEALEDAFENNAPEVHSYLHVPTGDVLRIVDGIADPQMHARIAADVNYLRIEPVSSREQYRWMERYIPMIDDQELRSRLTKAIDGKGAFRRFKDVLMSYGPERERWFAFRSERLRIFMEAWLNAHALNPVKRPVWVPDMIEAQDGAAAPSAETREPRPGRNADAQRRHVRELAESLGPRELDTLAAFAEFLKARRSSRRKAPAARASSAEAARKSSSSSKETGSSGEPASGEPADNDQPPSAKVPSAKRSAASGD